MHILRSLKSVFENTEIWRDLLQNFQQGAKTLAATAKKGAGFDLLHHDILSTVLPTPLLFDVADPFDSASSHVLAIRRRAAASLRQSTFVRERAARCSPGRAAAASVSDDPPASCLSREGNPVVASSSSTRATEPSSSRGSAPSPIGSVEQQAAITFTGHPPASTNCRLCRPAVMEDQTDAAISLDPRVKGTLVLGSESFAISSESGILSEQLAAMKEQSMGILKDYITKHNAPNDFPDEPIEGSSDEEQVPVNNPSKKSKQQT